MRTRIWGPASFQEATLPPTEMNPPELLPPQGIELDELLPKDTHLRKPSMLMCSLANGLLQTGNNGSATSEGGGNWEGGVGKGALTP